MTSARSCRPRAPMSPWCSAARPWSSMSSRRSSTTRPISATARRSRSRDILNSGVPLPVMKVAHKLVTDEVKRLDAPLLTRLEAAGFRLEYGEDGTGWPLKFRTRGGGYYFNVGGSELIADGKIRLIQAADIEAYSKAASGCATAPRARPISSCSPPATRGPIICSTNCSARMSPSASAASGDLTSDIRTPQHVDAHPQAGPVVHRRRVFAGAHLQPLHRAADRCDRGGETGEAGGVTFVGRVGRSDTHQFLHPHWRRVSLTLYPSYASCFLLPQGEKEGARPSLSTSLRAKRSNPSIPALKHGLLRCARNDGGMLQT